MMKPLLICALLFASRPVAAKIEPWMKRANYDSIQITAFVGLGCPWTEDALIKRMIKRAEFEGFTKGDGSGLEIRVSATCSPFRFEKGVLVRDFDTQDPDFLFMRYSVAFFTEINGSRVQFIPYRAKTSYFNRDDFFVSKKGIFKTMSLSPMEKMFRSALWSYKDANREKAKIN